jgi:hypothetical protein
MRCLLVAFCFLSRIFMSAAEEKPFAFAAKKRANNGQHVHNEQCCHGIVLGLKQALMRLFGLATANSIELGIRRRSDKSNAIMNQDLLAGEDVRRAVRGDKYLRSVVYNYFHNDGEGGLPD